MAAPTFQERLSDVTAAGYVNGFMACIVRIGEEAILHPGLTPARLIEKLNAEIAKHPGYTLSANNYKTNVRDKNGNPMTIGQLRP